MCLQNQLSSTSSGYPTTDFYTTPGAANRTVNNGDGFVVKIENQTVTPVPQPQTYQASVCSVQAVASSLKRAANVA